MQVLKSLFSRVQAQAVTLAKTPVELSAESLKLVGGGLPRVGGAAATAIDTSSVVVEDGEKLPRVG